MLYIASCAFVERSADGSSACCKIRNSQASRPRSGFSFRWNISMDDMAYWASKKKPWQPVTEIAAKALAVT
jgi:hypothetical protein